MLEAVARIRRRVARHDEFGAHQVVERRGELRLGHLQHLGEQAQRELAADQRADLRDLLGRREPVEARHQRVLQGRRDREQRQRALQPVAVGRVLEQARLHDGLGQLLDEQRDAVGLADDLGQHLGRQRLAAGHRADQRHRLLLAEPVQREARQVRRVAPGRHVFGPAGDRGSAPAHRRAARSPARPAARWSDRSSAHPRSAAAPGGAPTAGAAGRSAPAAAARSGAAAGRRRSPARGRRRAGPSSRSR